MGRDDIHVTPLLYVNCKKKSIASDKALSISDINMKS